LCDPGFDGTSIDAIAAAAKASKRTIYACYVDKEILFRAVVNQRMNHWHATVGRFSASGENLATSRERLARHSTDRWLRPASIELHRLVIAESNRWLELGLAFSEAASRPAIALLEDVLKRYRGHLRPIDLRTAAEQFIRLTVEHQLLDAHLTGRPVAAEIARRTHASVELFIHGIQILKAEER
jgi:AcrR family transcriptional regulator